MINKERYCEFIYNEGRKLEPVFGDVWTGSLLNEKNLNKSKNLHNIFTGEYKGFEQGSVVGTIFSVVVKYLVFVYMKFFFLGKKVRIGGKKPLVFSYYGGHVKFFTDNVDCDEIVFPQYTDYKRVRKNEVLTIYSFIGFCDLVVVPVLFLWNCYKFFRYFVLLSNLFAVYKKDTMNSFFGSVCIESIFYSRMFKRVLKYIDKDTKIYYVHEGQGWEKLLCKHTQDNFKVGIVCSAVSENLVNFFVIKEKWIPNAIAVLGDEQKAIFSKYHDNVFVYGSGRYKGLNNVKRAKKECDNILALLPFDSDMAIDLLKFILASNIDKPVYVRKHPYTDNKKLLSLIASKYRKDTLDLDVSLAKADIVILTGDTSTVFDALANGCLVVIVDMSSSGYVQLSCLADNDACVTVREPEELWDFISFGYNKLELQIKSRRKKRQDLLDRYFDFSVDEKQMTDRILNAKVSNSIL